MLKLAPRIAFIGILTPLFVSAPEASASEPSEAQRGDIVSMSGDQLLELSSRAEAAGDLAIAERTYRALFNDPLVEIRSEARFRLALLLTKAGRYADAAILLRAILDEQPGAQRVRLELAHVLELMGDEAGARRALRQVQAGGLPPDVARFVDRYSAALRAQKPVGASIEMALAPDSNINRATRSDTLGTVLGDFELDQDAQERSGIGMSLRGQSYARLPLSSTANLLGRVSGSADIYRSGQFNDLALAVTAGPELRFGADRLSVEAGGIWRWYGGNAYSRSVSVGANYFHPLARTAQMRATANLALVDNHLNSLLDGESYSASLGYERALSARAGFALTVSGERQTLRDPGYSTWSGQLSLSAYREFGAITLFAYVSAGRLRADDHLLLFPRARSDHSYRASLGASFRKLRLGTLAPFVRTTFERNRSNTAIYNYRKLRTEFGFTRAF